MEALYHFQNLHQVPQEMIIARERQFSFPDAVSKALSASDRVGCSGARPTLLKRSSRTSAKRHTTLALLLAVLALGCATLHAGADDKLLAKRPAFELIDQNGHRFTDVDLTAKPSVVNFGFTQCAVICPTTLYEVAERMRELGPLADAINFVFVSVDPERDTPDHLKEYIASFDSRIIGLSGAPPQIAALAGWLGAEYSKVSSSNGDYIMEHTINAFLISKGGTSLIKIYMGNDSKEQQVLQALRNLAQ